MEWKIERCSLGVSLKNTKILVGYRKNKTLAVQLELQLEKIVSPVKLQLTIYIQRQTSLFLNFKISSFKISFRNFKVFSLEKTLILVTDITSTFQGLYEIINDRKHRNIILIPLSGSWGPSPPFQ